MILSSRLVVCYKLCEDAPEGTSERSPGKLRRMAWSRTEREVWSLHVSCSVSLQFVLLTLMQCLDPLQCRTFSLHELAL